MSVKQKIQQITNPAVVNRRSFTTHAKIVKAYEKNNFCDIKYLNKDGDYVFKKEVIVQLTAPGLIAWFPKEDDLVVVQISDSNIIITGPLEVEYGTKIRSSINMKKDILSSSFGSTLNGHIF